MTFFKKTILSNPIATSKGYRIQFQPIGDDEGVIALEDETVIAELKDMAERRVGGVIEVTREQFDELKKKDEFVSQPKPRLSDPPQWPKATLDIRDGAAAVGVSREVPTIQPKAAEEPVAPKGPDSASNRPVPKRIINKPSVLS